VELRTLEACRDSAVPASDELRHLTTELRKINETLWVIEDDIRDCERDGNFGEKFIELARAVYKTNDIRAALKRDINVLLGSRLVEEKSSQPY